METTEQTGYIHTFKNNYFDTMVIRLGTSKLYFTRTPGFN